MSDPITGYTPMKVRCTECRKISRDPRVGPNGFCCAHCLQTATIRAAFTEAIDTFECAVSNGFTREAAIREAMKGLGWTLVQTPPFTNGGKQGPQP